MDIDFINESAMEMILNAGDARELIRNAVQSLKDGDKETYEATMEEANSKLTLAHVAQTKVIQTSMEKEIDIFSMLFTHAMDTLMTIKSEYEITNNLATLL